MNINSKSRAMIVDEIKFVVTKIEESTDIAQSLYYFSGVHSAVNRIYNQDFNEDLVLLHLVLQSTHTAFINRLNAIKKGGDNTVLLFDNQIKALSDYLKELAIAIENKKDLNKILKKFTLLFYSTTGNGYYLLQKGLLKI
jgi:uncharacterized protein YacL (UPF0231 family)